MAVMVLSLQKGITLCGWRLHGTLWLYLVSILDCRSESPAWNNLPCRRQPEVILRGRVEIHLQEHSTVSYSLYCIWSWAIFSLPAAVYTFLSRILCGTFTGTGIASEGFIQLVSTCTVVLASSARLFEEFDVSVTVHLRYNNTNV